MKAYVFVEGPSDVEGLKALWQSWLLRLRPSGHGIAVFSLKDKSNYLKKFGERAAERLVANPDDVVVGLPDLYPVTPFDPTEYQHRNLEELKQLQRKAVIKSLQKTQNCSKSTAEGIAGQRLYTSALKYDFEMLLLAAKEALRLALGTSEALGNWKEPVEDQNFEHPPKRVVEELFLSKSSTRRAYRDTKDAPSVLRRVKDIASILKTDSGRCTCPEFVAALRWMGDKFGVHCCQLP